MNVGIAVHAIIASHADRDEPVAIGVTVEGAGVAVVVFLVIVDFRGTGVLVGIGIVAIDFHRIAVSVLIDQASAFHADGPIRTEATIPPTSIVSTHCFFRTDRGARIDAFSAQTEGSSGAVLGDPDQTAIAGVLACFDPGIFLSTSSGADCVAALKGVVADRDAGSFDAFTGFGTFSATPPASIGTALCFFTLGNAGVGWGRVGQGVPADFCVVCGCRVFREATSIERILLGDVGLDDIREHVFEHICGGGVIDRGLLGR